MGRMISNYEGSLQILSSNENLKKLGVMSSGRSMGTLTVRADKKDLGAWYIHGLNVEEDARRKGIGRALLQAAHSLVSDQKMKLEVAADNEPAVNLYKSEGYQVEEVVQSKNGTFYLRMSRNA